MLIRGFLAISLLTICAAAKDGAVEQGQLDASPALFSVLAAINAAGYDADLGSPANSPLRQEIRREIEKRNPPSLEKLRQFFNDHKMKDPGAELSQYLWLALAVDGPPTFEYRYKTNELPPDVVPLEDFRLLLAKFYQEANLEELWKRSQPVFETVLNRYHGPVVSAVGQVNAYVRGSSSGALGARFQIYVDLLAAPNQVHMRTYRNDYFIVVTPSAEPQIEDVRHAYLHYIVDPLSVRYAKELEGKKSLIDYAMGAPLLADVYKGDFGLLATECLVKAIESRLAPAGARQGMVDTALKEGYVLTAAFAQELGVYEKQEQSLRYFYPEMVKGINLREEVERLDQVKFATERTVRKAKPMPVEQPAALTGVYKTLADAEQSYTARDLEKAKTGYLNALKQTDDKTLHAKAYYGLARVAALQKDPDTALSLFEKTLEMSPEPQIKAWTHVYLGRLAENSNEPERAQAQYRSALEVKGATDAARKAAQKGLDQAVTK